jgi:hypothetical protein
MARFTSFLMLLLGATLAHPQSLFVTVRPGGFVAPLPVLPSNSLHQEFTARGTRLDFVSVGFCFGEEGLLNLSIREESSAGPVIATSSSRIYSAEARDHIVFVFDPPVALFPGRRYVIDVSASNRAPFVLRGAHGDVYPGRLFIDGENVPGYDLDFLVGVFVPQVLSPAECELTVAEQHTLFIAPHAVFTNDYVTVYDGATLTVTVSRLRENVPLLTR